MEKLLWRCLEIQIHLCVWFSDDYWYFGMMEVYYCLRFSSLTRGLPPCCVRMKTVYQTSTCVQSRQYHATPAIMRHMCSFMCVWLQGAGKSLAHLGMLLRNHHGMLLGQKKRCQGYLKIHRSGWALYLFRSGTVGHYYQGHHDSKTHRSSEKQPPEKRIKRAGCRRGKFPQSQQHFIQLDFTANALKSIHPRNLTWKTWK